MNAEPQLVIEESRRHDTGDESGSAGARSATTQFLLQHCPWADLDAVLLVVSELVANAVRHTSGWWRLHLTAGADILTIEMDDSSPRPPVARAPDLGGSGGGFGWHMVQRLAGRVEVRPLPYGKRVRATWMRRSAGAPCGF
jgi:anti-sigma regulatory factor (Ser/Thr protein kinase)